MLFRSESVREVSERGALPVLVFDLDSTLFSTCPRNLKILEDFVTARGEEHPLLKEIWPTLTEEDMGWNVHESLQERGVEDEELLADLRKFWAARFFTDEFCEIDTPVPGAPEFVSACHDAGAFIYYLTGRHVHGMEKGTCLGVSPVFGHVSYEPPWVQSSGAQGGRVIAAGSPDANLEAKRVAWKGRWW